MKFLSLDIETTGLNYEIHQILEIAAIVHDTKGPLDFESAEKFHAILMPLNGGYNLDPYCAILHTKNGLFDDILQGSKLIKSLPSYRNGDTLYCNRTSVNLFFEGWLNTRFPVGKINLAGKNVAGFDLPFLYEQTNLNKNLFRHRTLDPAAFYVISDDEVMPDLETCKTRAGISGAVAHRAMQDAWDVVQLLHKAFTR